MNIFTKVSKGGYSRGSRYPGMLLKSVMWIVPGGSSVIPIALNRASVRLKGYASQHI